MKKQETLAALIWCKRIILAAVVHASPQIAGYLLVSNAQAMVVMVFVVATKLEYITDSHQDRCFLCARNHAPVMTKEYNHLAIDYLT